MTDWADEKAREVLNDLQLFPWSQVHLDIIATALRAAVEAERERCAGIPNVILTNHPPGPVRDALAEVRDAIAQGAPPWTPADFTKAAVEAEREACLGICDKIIAEPVLRDGSKAKHLRIRDAIAARKAP